METETLIVGGGLTGLSLAAKLSVQGRDFALVEARDRLGGRILTERVGSAAFDLGPAWFWPGQPRMEALVADLNLKWFEQFATGAISFEDQSGRVQHGRGIASMQGSLRIDGGMGALIDALSKRVSAEQVHLSTAITGLTQLAEGIVARTESGQDFRAQQVILALPPRLASTLLYTPKLPDTTLRAMTDVATWMAGQAKAVAIYERPFWREAGLSGDVMSHHGPMVEIHDASPAAGGPYALFGFIGVPPKARENTTALRAALQAQLIRIFGQEAANPQKLLVQDWAFESFTSTAQDLQPLYAHPDYGLPQAMARIWGGRLIFSGTETAPQFGGYLEGALEAAEIAMAQLEIEKV